jgi:diketogulonate reductase-like aldo/keto reductase
MKGPERTLSVNGNTVARFLYGTAWKEGETQRLTELAIRNGFRGIDTANQRRHYHEAAVGAGIGAVIASGLVTRNELFLQTKYTFQRGQDHRLPYDPNAPIATQVEQSFSNSLEHLDTDWIDSYLLHGPTHASGLTDADWEAWQAMETIHENGQARLLGVSNISLEQLQSLCEGARVSPSFVQNRCYAVHGWDRAIREFCSTRGITYQGFSLLTANRRALSSPRLAEMAMDHGCTVAELIFGFALEVGMIPLTGTSNSDNMRGDLRVFALGLQPDEISCIENCATG